MQLHIKHISIKIKFDASKIQRRRRQATSQLLQRCSPSASERKMKNQCFINIRTNTYINFFHIPKTSEPADVGYNTDYKVIQTL